MVDDYEHQGMWLEKIGDTSARRLPDQSEALLNLRLRLGEERSELTLYTHHALADAHHQFALLEKLFGWYTDVVTGAGIGPVKAEPVPESLEAVLSERGIGKLQRFGLERYLPAMFAYDLPPSQSKRGTRRPSVGSRAVGQLPALPPGEPRPVRYLCRPPGQPQRPGRGRDPVGRVDHPGHPARSDPLHVPGRSALLPDPAGRCDAGDQPGGDGDVPGRDSTRTPTSWSWPATSSRRSAPIWPTA